MRPIAIVRIMYLIFHRRLGTASALSTCGGGHTMSPSVVASCSFLLISLNASLALGRQPVDHHGFASPSTSVLFRIICSPCTPLPCLPSSGGFTLGASSFVTPWGLITHSRFLPFVRRAHHRHLASFSRPDLLAPPLSNSAWRFQPPLLDWSYYCYAHPSPMSVLRERRPFVLSVLLCHLCLSVEILPLSIVLDGDPVFPPVTCLFP